MKKKRVFIVVALLIAILALSIGYAVMSNTELKITGTASANSSDTNFKVRFDNTVTPTATKPDGATATGSIQDEKTAKITVSGLTTTNDEATVTYTIENYSDELSATLDASIENTNSTYFQVTKSFAKSSIASGEKTTITVTVKLLKTPISEQSTDITVTITATPVEA